jgi:hypothetical protein
MGEMNLMYRFTVLFMHKTVVLLSILGLFVYDMKEYIEFWPEPGAKYGAAAFKNHLITRLYT